MLRSRPNERSISGVALFDGTPAESSSSTVRRRRIGRGVAGRDCSFDEFGSTWAETVTGQDKGSRSGRAQAWCRTRIDRIPPAERRPLGSRFAVTRGAFFIRESRMTRVARTAPCGRPRSNLECVRRLRVSSECDPGTSASTQRVMRIGRMKRIGRIGPGSRQLLSRRPNGRGEHPRYATSPRRLFPSIHARCEGASRSRSGSVSSARSAGSA